jgi:hypothetical protein
VCSGIDRQFVVVVDDDRRRGLDSGPVDIGVASE